MEKAKFQGKIAVVTGGGSGIGEATCAAFAKEGAAIAVLDVDLQAAHRVCSALQEAGAQAMAVRSDVSDSSSVDASFAEVARRFGGIDILVNNAGGVAGKTLTELSDSEWGRVININLTGPFYGIRAVVPYMRERGGGAIVNMASLASKRRSFNSTVNYTSSKAGLMGLTRHAALELAMYNIRVNAVCPGLVATPLVMTLTSPEQRAAMADMTPAGCFVEPEDIAAAVLFLSSDGARMCTGIEITVDGGLDMMVGGTYGEYFERRGVAYEPVADRFARH